MGSVNAGRTDIDPPPVPNNTTTRLHPGTGIGCKAIDWLAGYIQLQINPYCIWNDCNNGLAHSSECGATRPGKPMANPSFPSDTHNAATPKSAHQRFLDAQPGRSLTLTHPQLQRARHAQQR